MINTKTTYYEHFIVKCLIILTGFCFIFISCSKSEDSNEPIDLTGTWKIFSVTTGLEYDINQDGFFSNDIMDETNYCNENQTFVFYENNTGNLSSPSYSIYGQSFEDGSFELDLECRNVAFLEEFSWSVSNNQVKMILITNGHEWQYMQNGNKLSVTYPFISLAEYFYDEDTTDTIEWVYIKQ